MKWNAGVGEALTSDMVCEGCGYNLRGLSRGGQCPECGGSVERSYLLHQQWEAEGIRPLRLAPARWVKTLAAGNLLLLIGTAAQAGLFASMMRWWTPGDAASLPIYGVATAAFGAGFWMIGAREPGAAAHSGETWARRTLRWGAAVAVVFAAGILLLYWVRDRQFWRVSDVVQSSVQWLLTVATMLRSARFARRMNRPGLDRWLKTLAWLIPATSVVRAMVLPRIPVWRVLQIGSQLTAPTGELTATVALMCMLYQRLQINKAIILCGVFSAVNVAAVGTLAWMCRLLWQAGWSARSEGAQAQAG